MSSEPMQRDRARTNTVPAVVDIVVTSRLLEAGSRSAPR